MSFKSPNYTQIPNDFFDMIPDMSESELKATLALMRRTFGFHRLSATASIPELMQATGMSDEGVRNGTKAAEQRGTFLRLNPDTKTKAQWQLAIDNPNDVDPNQVGVDPNETGVETPTKLTTGTVLKKEKKEYKENRVPKKKGDYLDLVLGLTAEQTQEMQAVENLIQEFERGLKVNISRSTKNQQIAKKIIKDGRPIDKWIGWLYNDEWRAAHAYLWKDLTKVWADFPQAFQQNDIPQTHSTIEGV